jgi:hypothetical protein
MAIVTAHTRHADPAEAAKELREGLAMPNPRFIIYFATPRMDPAALGQALRQAFGDVPAMGCTTAGEIITGHMLEGSVVAMAMDADTLADVAVARVADVTAEESVDTAFDALARTLGTGPRGHGPLRVGGSGPA